MDKKDKDFMNYLKEMIRFLSSDSYTQQQMYSKEILWNIADDVANEWDYEYFKVPIQNLIDSGAITIDIAQKFKTICDKFGDVSLNGNQYDPSIWTLEGFSNHPFWQRQRELAKQLSNEFEKTALNE